MFQPTAILLRSRIILNNIKGNSMEIPDENKAYQDFEIALQVNYQYR